jgi:tetratricopeptide (TPR) repeat protein
VDFLDFEGTELYFDEPLAEEVEQMIAKASELGRSEEAEQVLLRAYYLEPEHFSVLVAIYRYYYYTQRYQDALVIADRVLELCAAKLDLNSDWTQVRVGDMTEAVELSMVMARFYLFALKSSGFILLRMERINEALERLNKLSALDPADHFGSSPLIAIAGEYQLASQLQ